jgi:hypothetical protein
MLPPRPVSDADHERRVEVFKRLTEEKYRRKPSAPSVSGSEGSSREGGGSVAGAGAVTGGVRRLGVASGGMAVRTTGTGSEDGEGGSTAGSGFAGTPSTARRWHPRDLGLGSRRSIVGDGQEHDGGSTVEDRDHDEGGSVQYDASPPRSVASYATADHEFDDDAQSMVYRGGRSVLSAVPEEGDGGAGEKPRPSTHGGGPVVGVGAGVGASSGASGSGGMVAPPPGRGAASMQGPRGGLPPAPLGNRGLSSFSLGSSSSSLTSAMFASSTSPGSRASGEGTSSRGPETGPTSTPSAGAGADAPLGGPQPSGPASTSSKTKSIDTFIAEQVGVPHGRWVPAMIALVCLVVLMVALGCARRTCASTSCKRRWRGWRGPSPNWTPLPSACQTWSRLCPTWSSRCHQCSTVPPARNGRRGASPSPPPSHPLTPTTPSSALMCLLCIRGGVCPLCPPLPHP